MSDFRSGFAWSNAGAYTLKLRHTGTPSAGGGVGPMVTTDASCTVATNQDQTVFQRIEDDMGGGYVVRRLTPTECERLQGFPDGWTDIKKKIVKTKGGYKAVDVEETPDAPRYKALGNSMAVPCMRWIGQRIKMVEEGEL